MAVLPSLARARLAEVDAVVPVTPTRLYRAMRKDESGHPRCGAQGNLLGARPRVDIYPDAANNVINGVGGMSVTLTILRACRRTFALNDSAALGSCRCLSSRPSNSGKTNVSARS